MSRQINCPMIGHIFFPGPRMAMMKDKRAGKSDGGENGESESRIKK
jgi:hypothetical protein